MAEKSESTILRDLYVKLKPIFIRDIYIMNSKYVISGEYSNQKVAGNYICILDDKYVNVIKNFYDDSELIYIKDVLRIKDALDNVNEFVIIKEKHKQEEIKNTIKELLDNLDKVEHWSNLVEKCHGIVERFFKEKHIYSIKVSEGKSKIYVGKPLFPTITEKKMDDIFFHTKYLEDRELYELLVKYKHSHFLLYMTYFAIPIEE